MINKNSVSRKASFAGIAANVILCTVKLITGILTNSIAILSDGFNNLTDVGNAILIFIGYRIARKPADREHPYGHGRIEYMLSQGIAVMIIVVAVTLFKSSVDRLLNPVPISCTLPAVIILIASMLGKLLLAYYYNHLYKQSELIPLKAQIADSLSDAAGTAVLIAGYLLTPVTTPYLDAVLGLILSVMIFLNGAKIFLEMSSLLLGEPGNSDTYARVESILSNNPEIKGFHDLRIHSYGPDIIFGSADIDIDANITLSTAHDILDTLEEDIAAATGIKMTLHADPAKEDAAITELKEKLTSVLRAHSPSLSFHDFHYNRKLDTYYVDVEIPYDMEIDEKQLADQIYGELSRTGNTVPLEIRFDRH